MDKQVIAAMARWPDVPAVFGWLSVTESGQWRLHPDGQALKQPDSAGEPITSPQILTFMDRNYEPDTQGQWYFQNGPQRVYVRVDAAPLVTRTTTDSASGRLLLRTHTGLDVREITALYLDDSGRLYAATDRGPAIIAGRDLPAFVDTLQVADAGSDDDAQDVNDALSLCLETGATVTLRSTQMQGVAADGIPLRPVTHADLEAVLGFRRLPQPVDQEPAGSSGVPGP